MSAFLMGLGTTGIIVGLFLNSDTSWMIGCGLALVAGAILTAGK